MNTRDTSIQQVRSKIKHKDIDFIRAHSQIRRIGNTE
jgi:hypothetical protein